MIIEQLESKILSGGGLNSLTDSELSQLALHFVGDAPPSHVPRETVISILSEQDNVKKWQQGVVDKARQLASSKISETVENVQSRIEQNSDNPMVAAIKDKFGKWLIDSGYSVSELTVKLDKDVDGTISMEEISQFIFDLTGTQPPDWVLSNVHSVLDRNSDGIIEVSELWSYLEEIGFEIPEIVDPVIELPDANEAIDEMPETTIPDDEFEKQLEEIDNYSEPDAEQIVIEAEPIIQQETVEQVIEDENIISTTIERTIELLENSKLHSEALSIISNSEEGSCTLHIDRIENNLMVSDSYRGGKTLVGLLDGGPYNVAVLFEPEFNDLIEQQISKSKTVTFDARLFEWSSGLRQAKLKGKSLNVGN